MFVNRLKLLVTRNSYLSVLKGHYIGMSNLFQGPVYTERQRQCCNVTSDIALVELLRFLNKSSELLQKMGCKP